MTITDEEMSRIEALYDLVGGAGPTKKMSQLITASAPSSQSIQMNAKCVHCGLEFLSGTQCPHGAGSNPGLCEYNTHEVNEVKQVKKRIRVMRGSPNKM